jgi:uncharacterized membrane protein YdbT with pleckstrin-like domain
MGVFMSEEIIASRSPSQLMNLKSYFLGFLVVVIISVLYFLGRDKWTLPAWTLAFNLLPILVVVWKYFDLKCEKYELTNERLRIVTGILSRRTEEIELYRVKDFSLDEPFILRMFKLGNLHIEASDKSMPYVHIRCLPKAVEFKESLRECVEAVRDKKKVREVDFE